MSSPAQPAAFMSPTPSAPYTPVPIATTSQPRGNGFAIGLFDVGDLSSCALSYCCPKVAIASSRQTLDGSDLCFNFICLNPISYRWMVRSAYGIGDPSSWGEDCMYGTFCSCCVANQLYQTTKLLGNPSPLDSGPGYNINTFNNTFTSGPGVFMRFLGAFCCTPCMMGQVMENSIGMPFWLGCLCVHPFMGRNVMRYHYRIRPYTSGDATDDLLIPCCAVCAQHIIRFPLLDCVVMTAVATSVMQMFKEADIRGCARGKQYLVGYSPLQGFGDIEVASSAHYVPPLVSASPIHSDGSQPTGYGYGPVSTQSSHGTVVFAEEDHTL
jgi:hypothetical protein